MIFVKTKKNDDLPIKYIDPKIDETILSEGFIPESCMKIKQM